MKFLISLVLVLAVSSAAAEQCNVQIDTDLHVSPQLLAFYDKDKMLYQIQDGRHLLVDGKSLELNSAQQELVMQYDQQVRALMPEVRDMALDGIDLAILGVTTVFDELLGERNKISAQLQAELTHLKSDVRRYFDGDVISINREQKGTPELFGQYFETRMERIMETSVQDSIGDILVAVGKELFASGGDKESFEERMNHFGKTLEAQMQTQSAKLEERGLSLCQAAKELDVVENQLRSAVPNIRRLDLIRLNAASASTAVEI